MSTYGSLYDTYRLANSTVVPMYQGSAAPEALQVGAHLQQLYDAAKTGADDVQSASDNLQYMTDSPDEILANEVRNKISGDIKNMAASRDWENQVDAVRGLGRYYANRAMELQAPVKQYQEYVKSLDDKELGLTPEQKQILLARSRSGYQGLKKDGYGRFTGSFNGVTAAKNVDMPAWVDKVMQGMKEFKDAQSWAYDDQKGYIVKGKNGVTYVSKDRVDNALKSAMQMDGNMQAYMAMEGDNAKYLAGKIRPEMLKDNDPVKTQALNLAAAQGIPFGQAYASIMGNAAKNSIVGNALDYARNKYVFTQKDQDRDLNVMGPYWDMLKAQKNDLGLFGDLVTDVGKTVNDRYKTPDDVENALTTAGQNLEHAQNYVNTIRSAVGTKLGKKADAVTDADLAKYFADHPADQGMYKSNLAAIEGAKGTIAEINNIKDDAMDLATKAKNPGRIDGYKGLKTEVTKSFQGDLKKKNVTLNVDGIKIDKNNVDNYEIVDGDAGSFGGSSYIVVRDKSTGKEHTIKQSAQAFGDDGVKNANFIESLGGKFDGISWKKTWKDASNIRSNIMTMPLMNKTTPDGQSTKSGAYATRVSSIISAGSGGLNLKDADLNDLGDAKDIRTLIAAGKFDLKGITKTGTDGKLYAKISVEVDKDASDPGDRYKTVYVAADSNLANKMGLYAQQAGRDNNDIRAMQFGQAIMPNSGYDMVSNIGSMGRLTISGKPEVESASKGKIQYKKSKPEYEVVANQTGDPTASLTYEVYKLDENGNRTSEPSKTFDDQFDLGAYIDALRSEGRTVEKNNKR